MLLGLSARTDRRTFADTTRELPAGDAKGGAGAALGARGPPGAPRAHAGGGAMRGGGGGERRPRVLLDMDGVVVDWDEGFRAAWAARGHAPPERARSYYMEECVEPGLREEAVALFHAEGFFRDLPPREGALAAVSEVAEAYEVFICTSPVLTSPFCAAEKYAWVERHLGADWKRRVVITSDKTLVRGDVLIDDKPAITGAEVAPAWTHVLFDAPYNDPGALAPGDSRVRLARWADWRPAVERALAAAAASA